MNSTGHNIEDLNPVSPSIDNTSQIPDLDNISYTGDSDVGNVQQIVFSASKTEISTGPIPHPDLLKGYNDVIPNGAERIMRMAEKEQENRFLERKEIRETNKKIAFDKLEYLRRGQLMGFGLALIMLGLATLFVFTGHEGIAYMVFSVGAVSLVGLFLQVFISPKSKQKTD
ncbi:MAG: DUF2335 domain-containing protein [Muribaculaceae bacterium]|nr:DUF2335 domain-containing protein [Muribaculaceae bacterium]